MIDSEVTYDFLSALEDILLEAVGPAWLKVGRLGIGVKHYTKGNVLSHRRHEDRNAHTHRHGIRVRA